MISLCFEHKKKPGGSRAEEGKLMKIYKVKKYISCLYEICFRLAFISLIVSSIYLLYEFIPLVISI